MDSCQMNETVARFRTHRFRLFFFFSSYSSVSHLCHQWSCLISLLFLFYSAADSELDPMSSEEWRKHGLSAAFDWRLCWFQTAAKRNRWRLHLRFEHSQPFSLIVCLVSGINSVISIKVIHSSWVSFKKWEVSGLFYTISGSKHVDSDRPHCHDVNFEVCSQCCSIFSSSSSFLSQKPLIFAICLSSNQTVELRSPSLQPKAPPALTTWN